MSKKKTERKKVKKTRRLVISGVVIGLLFVIAAIMRVGVGEAEWAGISVSRLSPNRAVEYNIPDFAKGVVVEAVEGQAYYSGVKEGDLLTAVNQHPIHSVADFLRVGAIVNVHEGVLLDIVRDRAPMYITLTDRHGVHHEIKEFLHLDTGAMREVNGTSMTPVAMTQPIANTGGRLPTPKEQNAASKTLSEGHWMGMELIPLIPQLAKLNNIPANVKGVLVDEISLESSESGILAGDVVVAVEGVSTFNIREFTEATRKIMTRKSAKILVSRRGQLMHFTMSSKRALGFSQNEAASPIKPGAISPHRKRSKSCTACHIIMKTGGQLPIDAGDILPSPPPIFKGATPLHGNRGKCTNCHVVLKR